MSSLAPAMQPELEASGTLFTRIFHASPVAMAIFDHADGRCVAVNKAFADLLRCDAAAVVGRHVQELDLLDSDTLIRLAGTVTATGRLADTPLRVRAADGSLHDVLVSVQPAAWGGASFIITLLQDLTDYHRARTALHEAEARFRLFFEAIPLPVVVYDRDTLVILDTNDMATAQYGYERDELLGRSVLDLWPREDQAAQHVALCADDPPAGPTRHRKRDGSIIDIDVTNQPIALEGRRARLSIFADITDQLANEAARRNSEEQLRIIADVTTDVIWDYDPARRLAVYTGGMEALFGHEAGERPAPDWWLEQIHPDDRDRVRDELRAATASSSGLWNGQYRFRRADGEYAHVLDRGYILRDESDDMRVIGAMVDITRQVELQEATARAAMEERRRLARDLHDAVTQSVYSLTLMTEAARRRATLGDARAAFDYVERLGELARQALKEMRLLVYELRPAALQAEPLATALQTRLDAVEQRAGVTARLRVDVEHDLPIEVQTQLFRVAEEALNNTLKHASATAVSIIIGGDEGHLLLEIRDNGVGFRPAADPAAAGLGLVSMRERVDNLGGDLTVESSPGEGTTVRVSLELGEKDDG